MSSTATLVPKHSRLVAASPVYYGWVVVVAAALALAFTLPGQTAGVSLFIDAFIADLGLSRGAVSLAYTVATVLGSLTLPWTGRALDRFGPRRGVVVIAFLFGLACAGMGLVGGLVTLCLGFFAIRALGQGALGLVSLHAVNLWFARRRGLAIGLMGLGLALTTAFVPPLLEAGIDGLGWRVTYALMGLVLLLVLVPVGGLLFRGHPERFGLTPDGVKTGGGEELIERAYTLSEARHTGIFWLLAAGLVTTSAIGTGLLFHHVALMEAGGLGRDEAALLFVPFGLVMVVSNLGAGALLDRIGPRHVLALHLSLFAVMAAAVPLVHSAAAVLAYGGVFGLSQGLQSNLSGSAFAHYFGRRHVGAIKGFAHTLIVGGTALGPLLVALGEAVPGGYAAVLWGLALVPLGLALLALRRAFDLE